MAFESDKKYTQPIVKLYQPDDSYKKQPLPAPSGAYPYHLDVSRFVDLSEDGFDFYMVGDTGGVKYPEGQKRIASEICKDVLTNTDSSTFLYHLGDVVYHFGEAEEYERQFFKPYDDFSGPVFAIAGNHDSDVNPNNPVPYNSLDAFMKVFCDTESRSVPFSGGARRKSMIQPNVYWTLDTPLAVIIGLHSNVPKYGYIDNEQYSWFVQELQSAQNNHPDKLILVAVHHAPFTADFNHGASIPMITLLENAFEESGVLPHAVFSGHVHNYQRFEKTYPNGKVVPFIVCGAGGFDEIHWLVSEGDLMYSGDNPLLYNVSLKSYCDTQHGFLKLNLKKSSQGVMLTGNYFVVNKGGDTAVSECNDSFAYGKTD